MREKPNTPNGAGDISSLTSSSITDKPDSPADRELLKLKDMLTQRDNEISILHSNYTALLSVVWAQDILLYVLDTYGCKLREQNLHKMSWEGVTTSLKNSFNTHWHKFHKFEEL